MQTFVPLGPDLRGGFAQLDYRRLGKQRVEAWQILNILRGVDNEGNPKVHGGWANHPATKMWQGFPHGLAYYGKLCCEEWIARGYNDSLLDRFQSVIDEYEAERPWASGTHVIWPPWLFDDCVAETHRSRLIDKFPEHYQPLWPDTPLGLDYIWPTTPWKAERELPWKGLVRSLLTQVFEDDTIAISNEGNALTMRKGAMMARKKADVIDEDLELEELEELDEVDETEPKAGDSGMLTAKAAASMLGTDGRTLRKFLRKKYGVLGQGKRWEVDPADVDTLKAEFANFGRSNGKDDDGDDTPKTTKPKGKKVTQKAPPLDPIYDEIEDIDDLDDEDIIEDLESLEGPDDDELEEIDDLEEI